MQTSKQPYFPLLLLMGLSLIWGSSFILMKVGIQTYSPLTVGLARMFFASTVLIPLFFKYAKTIPRGKFKYLALVGIFGNFLPAILFAFAVPKLGSSIAGVLNALTPLITFMVGILFFSVATKRMQVLGIIIGLGGSALISFTNANGQMGGINGYAFYVFAANFCYAFSLNIIKTKLADIPSIPLTACSITLVWPVTLVGLLFSGFFTTPVQDSQAIGSLVSILVLGIIGTSFALVIFNVVIKLTSALFASTVTYLVPVVAIAIGVAVGEQVYAQHYIGMALILIGQIVVTKASPKPAPATSQTS